MARYIRIKDLLRSSLWIAVFIVRVGCIIEVHASTTVSTTVAHTSKDSREDLSSSLVRQSGVKKKITVGGVGSRRLLTSRNLSTAAPVIGSKIAGDINTIQRAGMDSSEQEDTCSSKSDGYFPNYGSDCTSYYFCAAGYQITFVCPPGSRFNKDSRKCETDVKCGSEGHKNICRHLPNGYYAKGVNSRKYFYCHNNAKVIELQCDEGKVFRANKCVLNNNDDDAKKFSSAHNDKLISDTCDGKSNGFYPALDSSCTKYYFCIGEAKTELACQPGMVFNGDICVQETTYKCPESASIAGNSIGSGSLASRGQTDQPETITGGPQNLLATESFESTTTTATPVGSSTKAAVADDQ